MAPILAAVISALALIGGYIYQRRKEQEAEIRRVRQDIYSRLCINLMRRVDAMDRVARVADWPAPDDPEYMKKSYELVMADPECRANLAEGRELTASLALYGTDDAIRAYVHWIRQGWAYANKRSSRDPDTGQLIQALRKSVYPRTRIRADEIDYAIRRGPN